MRMRWRLWMLTVLCPIVAQATPELRCHFEVNAEHFEHRFTPVSEPYTVQSVNLADRFRFKAVVLGNDTRVDLVNLYVSYQTERQPMVLQHVKFVAPVAQRQPAPDALTGLEANLRFNGKENMATRIFGRLSAWQNWIFQRPNAVGEKGALKVYGKGEKVQFDMNRV